MAIDYIGRKMRARTLALVIAWVIIGALGLSTAAVPPAQGQTVEQELPPPALPSVSDYSLPPGDTETPTNSTVQGPVEENGTRPQPAPNPDDAQSPSQPIVIPPTPKATASPDAGNQRQPATVSPAPRAATTPDPATETNSETQDSAQPDTDQSLPDVGTSQPVPTDQPVSDALPEAAPAAAPQEASDTNKAYYFGGGFVILLLAALGLYFWRRRASADLPEDEVEDEPAPVPAPATRKAAPKIYSPPNPAEPEKPSPISNDGFVTSKIGATPQRRSPPVTIPLPTPQAPLVPRSATNTAEHLQIEFTANAASSTLLNAVLNYTVTLTNISDQDLRNIRLSGAMMQADTQNAQNAAVQSGDLLHETESLSAGDTVTLTGDIRLPLSAIRPIAFKSQALFIPLAHFGTEYVDDKGNAHHQGISFIIGREYEPPRAKMAPFRLDLGPRSFGPVGQRPLATG